MDSSLLPAIRLQLIILFAMIGLRLSAIFPRPDHAFQPLCCDPTSSVYPFPTIRLRFFPYFLRSDCAFFPISCSPTAFVGQKAATFPRLFPSKPAVRPPDFATDPRSDLCMFFPVFEPSPFAAIFSASAQPSVPPAALLPYNLFCNIIYVPFYRIFLKFQHFRVKKICMLKF